MISQNFFGALLQFRFKFIQLDSSELEMLPFSSWEKINLWENISQFCNYRMREGRKKEENGNISRTQ